MVSSICVFCGSSSGFRTDYGEAAQLLGRQLATDGVRLVYGGANRGLMGILADACLEAGGEVIGVMPRFLFDREIAHRGLTDLRVVESMHERKALMADLAEAFIAMPGGFGTFEEFLESLTWTQLGLQKKPCGLLNVLGYYDPLLLLADRAAAEGFAWPEHRDLIVASAEPAELLAKLNRFIVPEVSKWVDPRPGDRR